MRFILRDRERLLLDTSDLIRLLEQSNPLSPEAFDIEMRRRHACIVLVPTNVSELVPQNENAPADPKRVARLMNQVERLPHTFLRTPDLALEEFHAAISAYETSKPIRPVDPYFDHWWETLWKIPPRIARYVETREEIELLDSLTLNQQVAMLLGNPARLVRFEKHEERLRQVMIEDRARFGTTRGSRAALIGAVARQIEWHGLQEPRGGVSAFVDYLVQHPEACPSWRLGFDVWEEYRCNLNSVPMAGDFADFSHVQLLPYVTYATLDRPWRGRCEQARDRLRKSGADVGIYGRVFPDLSAIIAAW